MVYDAKTIKENLEKHKYKVGQTIEEITPVKKEAKIKAVIYVRVSSVRQEYERQLKELKNYCAKNNISVKGIYKENKHLKCGMLRNNRRQTCSRYILAACRNRTRQYYQ